MIKLLRHTAVSMLPGEPMLLLFSFMIFASIIDLFLKVPVVDDSSHCVNPVIPQVRSSQGVLRCRMCPYKTKDEEKFERHQGTVHRLKGVGNKSSLSGSSGSDKSGQGSAAGRAVLSCEHCDFTADLAQNLRIHALSCLGMARRKLFRCPQCPFQVSIYFLRVSKAKVIDRLIVFR